MSKIHSAQNISYLLMEKEKDQLKIKKKSKAFIDYSHTLDDTHTNLEDYNPTKKRSVNSI